jgi:hypothetical protein
MTIGTQLNSITVDGNGATTTFAYPFLIPAASDAIVIYTAVGGVQTTLSSTQFTITGIGSPNGGTVTYPLAGSPIPSGSFLTVARILPEIQGTSISGQGPTFASIEAALDYLTMLIQQITGTASRAIVVNPADPPNPTPLPIASVRAGQFLTFDINGNPTVASVVGGSVVVSAAMQPVVAAATTEAALALMSAAPVMASIGALRANTLTPPAIVVTGYRTLADGGGGLYVYVASDTSSSDNGGSIIVDASGHRWYLETFGAPLSVKQFGAYGDNSHDDTTAIQAAITAGGPGGKIWFPVGVYLVSTTLAVAANDLWLTGAGSGDLHDFGGTQIIAPCIIRWNGSSGGTLLKIAPTGTTFLSGNAVSGIFFDGNAGLAAIGFNLVSGRLGTYSIVGAHFTTAIVQLDVSGSISDPAGCSENLFVRISGYQTNSGDGAILVENGSASWNCSQNIFGTVSGDFLNGPAINIINADSEFYQTVKLFQSAGGSDVGIRLNGGATAAQSARNNTFWYVGVNNTGGSVTPVFAGGTSSFAVASKQNNIVFLDTANNPTLPSLDTGATLWWGEITAPVGLRTFSSASNSHSQTDASGLITQSGLTGTIAAGGSLSVTLPIPLTSFVVDASAIARTTPSPCSAISSTTTLTIHNAGTGAAGAPTDFYWEVKGQ